MSLKQYNRNGWIERSETSPQAIADGFAIVDRDVRQSQVLGLCPEWRLHIAYNAALQLATLALEAEGFTPERTNKHMRAIETLAFTVGLSQKEVDLLDRARRLRHRSVYEEVGSVSEQQAREMVQTVRSLQRQVERWMKRKHPDKIERWRGGPNGLLGVLYRWWLRR